MALESPFSLSFLWDFLKPILSDALKEKIKPEPSHVKARKSAFDFFQLLEDLSFHANEFVAELERFVLTMSSNPTLEEQQAAKDRLISSMFDVNTSIRNLPHVVRNIDVQIKIHFPDIISSLPGYAFDRSASFPKLHHAIDMDRFAQEDIENLEEILENAKKNRDKVDDCIEKFRSFIAKEFSFKDSY